MSLRTLLVGIFAVVFGVAAAVGAYVLSTGGGAAPPVETVSVVVATSDAARGQSLSASTLRRREWPKDALPAGVITEIEDAVDRTVLHPISKGELLLDNNLAPKGSGRGLASIIPDGMRAVTIQTPNVSTGVGGFILPGNKVDVVMTAGGMGSPDLPGGSSTFTLLQNIEVLAVDQRIEAPQDNKIDTKDMRSVTLLVTPADANKLELGQNKGTLHLTLRNPQDNSVDEVEPATLLALRFGGGELGLKSTEVEAPPPGLLGAAKSGPPAQPQLSAVAAPVEEPVKPPAPTRQKVIHKLRTLRGVESSEITLQTSELVVPQSAAERDAEEFGSEAE